MPPIGPRRTENDYSDHRTVDKRPSQLTNFSKPPEEESVRTLLYGSKRELGGIAEIITSILEEDPEIKRFIRQESRETVALGIQSIVQIIKTRIERQLQKSAIEKAVTDAIRGTNLPTAMASSVITTIKKAIERTMNPQDT
ncbi:MAG: hypothetical protein ABIH78_01355 [Candidatus Peregrinibacteria bacterium]